MNEADPMPPAPRRSSGVLLLLMLAYVFNFVDRNIIGILAVPIRTEFALSDTALSSLGVAFGIVYAVSALPIAAVADRWSRVNVIAAAVGVWSLFTAACGTVGSVGQLIVARMGVAVGEAGGIAPSYALIADYFPPKRRARALAVFSLGIPIGSAIGIFFGGWLAAHWSWRTTFLVVGLLGLPVGALVKLFIAEPQQSARAVASAGKQASHARLLSNPSFWLLSLGAACGSIPGYGLIFWLPSFFTRSAGLPLEQVGWFYGSVVLVGGMAGTWLGGVIGDRLGPQRPGAYALIPAACFLVAVPTYAVGLFAPNLVIAWLMFAIAQMLSLAWLGPVVTAVQHLVPADMRARAGASFLFINNLVGIAFGTFFLGFMSDRLRALHGDSALQYSILYILGFYLLSSAVYFLAARRLGRDAFRGDV